MDLSLGITFHFGKKKEPPVTARVYYNEGEHIIEFHDPKKFPEFARALIPPYTDSGEQQPPSEPKEQQSYHG